MKAASPGTGSCDDPEAGCPFSILSTAEIDPFAAYEHARLKDSSGPWDPGLKAWLVLDYADCVHVETHEDEFANPYAGASPLVTRVKGGKANITLTQGETHERLRRFHMRLLSAKAVAEYREHHVRPIISW